MLCCNPVIFSSPAEINFCTSALCRCELNTRLAAGLPLRNRTKLEHAHTLVSSRQVSNGGPKHILARNQSNG